MYQLHLHRNPPIQPLFRAYWGFKRFLPLFQEASDYKASAAFEKVERATRFECAKLPFDEMLSTELSDIDNDKRLLGTDTSSAENEHCSHNRLYKMSRKTPGPIFCNMNKKPLRCCCCHLIISRLRSNCPASHTIVNRFSC